MRALLPLVAVLISLTGGFSLTDGSVFGAERPRPNILFIYTDDQPYKTVGCYPGAPDWVRTPNIDRLAKSGVRFSRSYLGAWCMPSRACLLTGRLPHAIESL